MSGFVALPDSSPLLAQQQQQQQKQQQHELREHNHAGSRGRGVSQSSSGAGTFSNIFNLRRPLNVVHPNAADVEPVLPATALPADQETRLHRGRWANLDGHHDPNPWAAIRHIWREEFAEFWGSFFILLFGAGVECQVALHYSSANASHDALYGNYLQARFAWAVGVAMAVWMAGGISGGHCNPTVTIVLYLFRGFPLRKVPGFIIAQVLGTTLASLMVYANYTTSISNFEGGSDVRTIIGPHATAGLFFTIPNPNLPYIGAAYSEFLASMALIMIVFALADRANLAPPKGVQPFAMFLALLGIGSALGVNTGYAMNGARDTGPRLALWMVGYGSGVWTHSACYWLWAPWLAAIVGGALGAAIYDAFIYVGLDSPVNRPRGGRKPTPN